VGVVLLLPDRVLRLRAEEGVVAFASDFHLDSFDGMSGDGPF
jgi:hypothetical protein